MIRTLQVICYRMFYVGIVSIGMVNGLLLSTVAHAQPSSEYTSLKPKDCQTMASPFYHASCPAKGGYQLEVYAGDLRSGVDVIYADKKISYTPDNNVPHELGKVAEWRYQKKHNKRHYHALIYRLSIAQLDTARDTFLPRHKDKQALIVIRLSKEKSCVIGVVKQDKKMNQTARDLADSTSSTCID